MSVIGSNVLAGAAGQAAGYEIQRSLRFNRADSAYLNKGLASTGDKQVTVSFWVKRSKLGVEQCIIDTNRSYQTAIKFDSSDRIHVYTGNGAGVGSFFWITTQVFRDCSSWYHIVAAWDTTQATATNRLKLYVNGVQVTTFSTQQTITQNMALGFSGAPAEVGNSIQNNYLDAYLAEFYLVDGVSGLTASDFGEYDDNNVWQPKAYSGSYGTNGFRLDFSDNSSNAALGTDSSGNSNTWTVNNLSVASGAGNDSLIDTPTNYEAASGNNGGNYATFNAVDKGSNITLSNGNLDVSKSSTTWANSAVRGTIGVSSGKWYWEITKTNAASYSMYGVAVSAASFSEDYGAPNNETWTYISNSGNKFGDSDGGSGASYGATFTNGDVIGIALDMDAGTLVFYKNGSSQGTAYSTLSGKTIFPWIDLYDGSDTASVNFGQRPFAYTAPSGFKALCTSNLPDPTIADGSTAMDVALYTGNGTSQSITGLGFSPDFVWVKNRAEAVSHFLFDAVRGNNNYLRSDGTFAEDSGSSNQLSFATDGFDVSGTGGGVNKNTISFVGWAWDGGTSTVSNTDGSITSSVRANASAGFSIVTYTGNGSAGATVGHGLGAAPSFYVVKRRNTTGSWLVYSSSLGATKWLELDNTGAVQTSSAIWNDTAPTSSVISLGTSPSANGSGNTFVAYCFAPVEGYSAFGSYVGTGTSDNSAPFVYTGMRPAFVIIKKTSGTSNWFIHDSARSPYNAIEEILFANSSSAEDSTYDYIDFLSNGFKHRFQNTDYNTSGATYVWAAFAEHPLKHARAR